MALPSWIEGLRKSEIVAAVKETGLLDSLTFDRIRSEVVGGGQADFAAQWVDPRDASVIVSPDARAHLYAYCNQQGHLEELGEAFSMLFGESQIANEQPIVLDIGCGPFTGGLAFAAALGATATFSYIGVDRATSMHRLGEKLAQAAVSLGGMQDIPRVWGHDLESIAWSHPARWQPVVVIVSYLLASPTLDASKLVAELNVFLARLGRGPVTVLYTNSPLPGPNRSFPAFRGALEAAGFGLFADDTGQIRIERWQGPQDREVRYALFHRHARHVLEL